MNKEFSIIIPVYNVANYLDKAIESVLSQNISADMYEIILVDDGSTDASGDKCDQWENRFPTLIKVIHKKKCGSWLCKKFWTGGRIR